MKTRFLNAALLAGLAGCGTNMITAPPTPESARIEVARSDSRIAVLEAMTAEGFTVAKSDGDVIETMPVEVATQVFVTYRALILADRVVLSGVVRNEAGRALAQHLTGIQVTAPDAPLHDGMTGILGEAWARLERVAAIVRG